MKKRIKLKIRRNPARSPLNLIRKKLNRSNLLPEEKVETEVVPKESASGDEEEASVDVPDEDDEDGAYAASDDGHLYVVTPRGEELERLQSDNWLSLLIRLP